MKLPVLKVPNGLPVNGGVTAGPALSRDYFRVEDTQGYRFWLFRYGLYERETTRPDWYMHGLFS